MFISVILQCYTDETPPNIYFKITPYVGESMTWYGAASFDDSSAFDTTCDASFDHLYDYVYPDGTAYDYCTGMEMARNPSL